jgi:hypothetical protein
VYNILGADSSPRSKTVGNGETVGNTETVGDRVGTRVVVGRGVFILFLDLLNLLPEIFNNVVGKDVTEGKAVVCGNVGAGVDMPSMDVEVNVGTVVDMLSIEVGVTVGGVVDMLSIDVGVTVGEIFGASVSISEFPAPARKFTRNILYTNAEPARSLTNTLVISMMTSSTSSSKRIMPVAASFVELSM